MPPHLHWQHDINTKKFSLFSCHFNPRSLYIVSKFLHYIYTWLLICLQFTHLMIQLVRKRHDPKDLHQVMCVAWGWDERIAREQNIPLILCSRSHLLNLKLITTTISNGIKDKHHTWILTISIETSWLSTLFKHLLSFFSASWSGITWLPWVQKFIPKVWPFHAVFCSQQTLTDQAGIENKLLSILCLILIRSKNLNDS